jgi:hypothetical protein
MLVMTIELFASCFGSIALGLVDALAGQMLLPISRRVP